MKDIQLRELPKSKEFMKHVEIADSLTKETGLEHGFTFCKPNDEIIVDKMCVGTECNIEISHTKICEKNANNFHSHPGPSMPLDFSTRDIYSATRMAYNSKKNNIHCVKSINEEDIACQKIVPPKDVNLGIVTGLYKLDKDLRDDGELERESYDHVHFKIVHGMNRANQVDYIGINNKTGKITEYWLL